MYINRVFVQHVIAGNEATRYAVYGLQEYLLPVSMSGLGFLLTVKYGTYDHGSFCQGSGGDAIFAKKGKAI